MPPRNTRSCDCPAKQPEPQIAQPVRIINDVTEQDRLWRHVVHGTETCIKMLGSYKEIGIEGFPESEVRRLADILLSYIESEDEVE